MGLDQNGRGTYVAETVLAVAHRSRSTRSSLSIRAMVEEGPRWHTAHRNTVSTDGGELSQLALHSAACEPSEVMTEWGIHIVVPTGPKVAIAFTCVQLYFDPHRTADLGPGGCTR